MTRKSAESRVYARILLLLLILAFSLRLTALDAQSLWYDEGVTAMVAQYDPATLIRWTADDIQPPLYYLVVFAWGQVAGWSEWSLRFVSAAFGVLLVPLLAALAHALTRQRSVALLAALFTALHPLLLYYSQEARMYMMLVVWGVVAAYCVLRVACRVSSHDELWLWIGYVLAATAAVYTHYFAVFLLAALNVAYLLQQYATRNTQHVTRNFFLANATIAVLFAPWIGVLITRLRVDTSYWQGVFKLGEAVHDIAIRFTLGETILETAATPWLWIYAAVTVFAVGRLAVSSWRLAVSRWQVANEDATQHATRNTPSAPFILLYSLLYLLLPIAAVLALASTTPKFNPRYVMLALPGLIVLWSVGLGTGDWRLGRKSRRDLQSLIPNPRSPIPGPQSLVLIGILLAGFLYADVNWFMNPAFTKDQWRELTAYVRTHKQPDEAVVLVSGHAWPVWQYYAPEIDVIRLPEIEILDVGAVLDFTNTTDPLRFGLTGKQSAWLVGWQDEVIDPMDVTPLQLSRGGEELPVNAQFWGLDLRRFAVDPSQIRAQPPIEHPANINFGNVVEFLGHTIDADGTLLLYGRQLETQFAIRNSQHATRNTQHDLLITGETLTPSGLAYADLADQRPAGYDFPFFRWQPGQVTVGRIPARDWAGEAATPGNYRLRLGVYDPAGDAAGLDVLAADGTPLGKRATLEVTLPQPTLSILGENPTTWTELAPGIFADAVSDPRRAAPGQPMQLTLRWWTAQSLAGRMLEVAWQQDGETLAAETFDVAPGFPPVTWANEWQMRTLYPVRAPQELEAGGYQLSISLLDGGGSVLSLPIEIVPDERTFVVPDLALPLDATFGGQVTLRGLAEPLPDRLPVGEALPLTLVWQAIEPTNADLSVTVQWLDDGGRPAAQIDERLPGGSSSWVAGEVTIQPLVLSAPATPGTYRLIVAVYDPNAAGLLRLRLNDGRDSLDLGVIEIFP